MSHDSERGAAAVEFAILLPLLLMLVLGTIEFGRAYNAQITLTNAARDGVRVMAISGNQTAARSAARNAAASLSPGLQDTNIQFGTVCPSTIPAGTSPQTTFTINYTLSTITGVAGPFPITGKGVMLCGG
ncbi:putative TadZ/CpaE, associated with Flp pilus assembly [Arthrobacter sp. 9AX]|uniref:TadE family protein n=1 Tax=Arthrobacter sp. 9AX TaxID=2653131 RepID=UPI0012F2E50B|nr:TadE family protein [Arthrobacter sp. 9AX]VXB66219.1 putative TadZ/CpaE, associated with Flp pilus assembly [Arthrobacter sp. 9AX]